jgi:hypothetical protein
MIDQTDPALAACGEYQRLCGETEAAIEAYRLAVQAGDFKHAEAHFSEVNASRMAALDIALKTRPATADGAVALLRLVAANAEDMAEDPDHKPTLIAAIRAAADAIDGAQQ